MKITELTPLVTKASELEDNPDAKDVFEFVRTKAEAAATPSMAQSVCEHVMSLCHPRAWGDRYVQGFEPLTGWQSFLSELAGVAQNCWDRISENNGATRRES